MDIAGIEPASVETKATKIRKDSAMEDYISVIEAASIIGVTRQRIGQMIQEGKLKYKLIGGVHIVDRADALRHAKKRGYLKDNKPEK